MFDKRGNMILFIAKYPSGDTVKEGMSQRMLSIDAQFHGEQRMYLFVSPRKFWRKKVEEIMPGVKQYQCNLFLHFFLIYKLIQNSKIIYFHSILNAFTVFPFLFINIKSKTSVLDVHGVVPEEQILNGNKLKGYLYNLCEKKIFEIIKNAIVVTNSMKEFYKSKYPVDSKKINFIIYPIISENLIESFKSNNIFPTDKKIAEKVEIIYSGNMQAWQNVPLMIKLIKNNLNKNLHFTILTGEINKMQFLFLKNELTDNELITIKSVTPKELQYYYSKAHYGFILRDDLLVNNVACPTKMIEYLFYGITPIIKSCKIGDFHKLGIENLNYKDFNIDNLYIHKSLKNHEIAKEMINQYIKTDLRKIIEDHK